MPEYILAALFVDCGVRIRFHKRWLQMALLVSDREKRARWQQAGTDESSWWAGTCSTEPCVFWLLPVSLPLTSLHLLLWGWESCFSSKNKTLIPPAGIYFQARPAWHGVWPSFLEDSTQLLLKWAPSLICPKSQPLLLLMVTSVLVIDFLILIRNEFLILTGFS